MSGKSNQRLCNKFAIYLLLIIFINKPDAGTIRLDELDLSMMTSGWSVPQKNTSIDGNPIIINEKKFTHGIGTHAPSILLLDLHQKARRFTAQVGIDSEIRQTVASVEFQVVADNKLIWKSGPMSAADGPVAADVDLSGVTKAAFYVTDYDDGSVCDHADWADARIEFEGEVPVPLAYSIPKPYLLTPPSPKTPKINGAKVFGVRPGSPFLYTIAATGEKPLVFSASGLPVGLTLDSVTGQISGTLSQPGVYKTTLHAKNGAGEAACEFRIVVGDQICLTPPMGWNSWNIWGDTVDADKIKAAAQALVDSGLINHGWSYINIDDSWQGKRGGVYNAIQGNNKFPDMQGLCNYVHSLGLKIGLYSTPWISSFAGYRGGSSDASDGSWEPFPRKHLGWKFGEFSFAKQDVQQWTEWEVDYLKYDWKPLDLSHVQEMSDLLKKCKRDIIFSLSNSADIRDTTELVKQANLWRTSGDIRDTWNNSMVGIGFAQHAWSPYAGPGHWNDADMLVIGNVGWGGLPHASYLSADEQYSHISLWCLLSSPLLLGCDLTRLDAFTLNLLTNDEILAVNQDPRGEQAQRIVKDDKYEIWAKRMEDGSLVAGFFNTDYIFGDAMRITASWEILGLKGSYQVRDLWRQKEEGAFRDSFSADVPVHGVKMVRFFK